MVASPRRRAVGVIFGSRSMEHGVSVLTAHQAVQALDRSRYDVTAIYITERGEWLASDWMDDATQFAGLPLDASRFERAFRAHARPAAIVPDPTVGGLLSLDGGGLLRRGGQRTRLDVTLLALHGTFGEDGSVQGLLDLADIPYTGTGILGSALGMDKIAMKDLWRAAGLPVVSYHALTRSQWESDREGQLDRITAKLDYPIFVKPAGLGSSIGISRTVNREDLGFALDVAANYDRRLIAEQGLDGAIDINCSVLGSDESLLVSACERPVSRGNLLSYEDKYLHGKAGKLTGGAAGMAGGAGMEGMARELPANLPPEQTARIQELALAAYRALDGAGVARVDTLLTASGQIYLNEINTLPGSLSSYLWEASGVSFSQLLDRLIEIALDRARERRRNATQPSSPERKRRTRLNDDEPTSHFYNASGLRLHYLIWGAPGRPPLIMVHGGRDHARMWDVIARALVATHTIYVPDLRGHGDSDWATPSQYSIPDFVSDLTVLVDRIREDYPAGQRLALVGHSRGAGIVLRYAGTFPEYIDRVVAIDGVGRHTRWEIPAPERLRAWIGRRREADTWENRVYPSVEAAAAPAMRNNRHLSRDLALELARLGTRVAPGGVSWKFDPRVRFHPAYDFPDDELEQFFAAITAPVLYIRGDESHLGERDFERWAPAFPDVRAVIVPGAGHWVQHDRPEEIVRLLESFLGSRVQTSPG